jgi:hypothetical protein
LFSHERAQVDLVARIVVDSGIVFGLHASRRFHDQEAK